MTDRQFYLVLTILVLTIAAGEIVYGVIGPLSISSHYIEEF